MVYIYAVRLDRADHHEHITSVRWKNPDSGASGQSSKAEMVNWITNKKGAAYVCGNGHLARVGVVNADPPYIRTHADGVWTDNLLALPRF
jgi:hypothetical protein